MTGIVQWAVTWVPLLFCGVMASIVIRKKKWWLLIFPAVWLSLPFIIGVTRWNDAERDLAIALAQWLTTWLRDADSAVQTSVLPIAPAALAACV